MLVDIKKKGYPVLDYRSGVNNPRNSEGAFLDLKDGRIMFVYSRFIGESHSDDAKACIVAVFSTDCGETWQDERVIDHPDRHEALNIMSVSLLRMQNGDIGLFYVIRRGWHDARLHLFRSSDEGLTWSEPVCCVPGLGYYVVNNDRVVRLSSGRLLVPSALHKMRTTDTIKWGSFDSRGTVYVMISDDDGVTWREATNSCSLTVPHTRSGLQEPGIIELKNGALWMYHRTDLGRQYESFSVDGGETWSEAVPSQFTSSVSPLSVKRNPSNGHLLAVWNPIPNYQLRKIGKHSWGRAPLVGAISQDEGKTWTNHFAIQTEEDNGGYCYTAIHFTSDAVLLAYCAGEPEDGICLARLKMTKVLLSDIYTE
ncbi:sialidase family protein [Paenibacillus sp. GXUN7292]|uniref:sialidase family protein n=1 Tax=Paenibacillus sp. GXUN7292 TaxID=3422499 RepID=UPI003D7E4F6F